MKQSRIYIEREGRRLVFGSGIFLSRLEAEPAGGSAAKTSSLTANDREVEVLFEGYLFSGEEESGGEWLSLMRRLLSRITSPEGEFSLAVGDRHALLSEGRLTFHRQEPFSGEEAERFTLRAVNRGGYFTGDTVTAVAEHPAEGFSFPLMEAGESHTAGTLTERAVIRLSNGGDVAVGFLARLSPDATARGFSLTDSTTGKHVTCDITLGSGDVIEISTRREDLFINLIRGTTTMSLTGRVSEGSELFTLTPGEHTLILGGDVGFSGELTFTEKFVTF